jgi:cytochrome c oxidase assembly protein subunit 15
MENSSVTDSAAFNRRPFLAAWMVAAPMFCLIWLGGLVTTQDAGMAVPDWPGTYGYNMFAYPISAWLYGPLDLFIEHGHRLLGALVGFLSIVFCVVAWRNEPRRWVGRLSIALLLCIIFQGALGGARVLMDARTVAMIHGCFAPLVFAFACSLVLVTSRSWRGPIDDSAFTGDATRGLRKLLVFQSVACILQLFVGAQLRHTPPATPASAFMGFVHAHLTLAFVVTFLILWTAIASEARLRDVKSPASRRLKGIARLMVGLICVQVLLGVGTWIVNYALPVSDLTPLLAEYTIAIKGYWEAWITTFHQATGSLIIAFSVVATLLAFRYHRLSTLSTGSDSL